ncbi:MAG TPA: thioredoxin family protein [Nitrososphaerales archaeon]|nr:thioredoxin family protein [Nitrososphaerales archaeon]
MLHGDDISHIKKLFDSKLKRKVKVLLFTVERGCSHCREAEQLLREISAQSSKLKFDILDIHQDNALADELNVTLTPATVILSNNGAKLYYFGMPGGYQLKCLIEDIVDASEGSTDLAPVVREMINKIRIPIDIKVFVTPSCPYSPIVVRTAHRFAIENQKIRAQMIESMEFRELTEKYGVIGVPKTFINDSTQFDGTLNDELFAQKLIEATLSMKS